MSLGTLFSLYKSSHQPSAEVYDAAVKKVQHCLDAAEQFIANHQTLSRHLLKAKEEYVAITGLMNENDEGYINRVKAYLSWFLFNWEIPPQLKETPFQIFLRHYDDKELGKQVFANIHSLFMFEKQSKGKAVLRDLMTNKRYVLGQIESFDGFEPGYWFETRIYQVDGCQILGNFIILHPRSVFKLAMANVKALHSRPKAFVEFMLQLQNFYHKWKSYKHIDVRSIYALRKPTKGQF